MKLGIFDSGIGGEAVAIALQKTFPEAEIIALSDHKNVPYGDKTRAEVIRLTDLGIQPLMQKQCDIIIIACNTITTIAIEILRTRYPQQKFIGIEPMIKQAASLTKTHTIGVCATPATLASDRYATLVRQFGADLTIIEPDCSQWAYWIENNQLNRLHIAATVNRLCEQGVDVIVLGCTHYHWIKDLITELAAGRARVIEPSEAIARRVLQLVSERATL